MMARHLFKHDTPGNLSSSVGDPDLHVFSLPDPDPEVRIRIRIRVFSGLK
jgi:hypothetical protein